MAAKAGKHEQARDPLSRAVLACALWDAPEQQGRDRGRARELAELARTAYAEANSLDELQKLEAWLLEASVTGP